MTPSFGAQTSTSFFEPFPPCPGGLRALQSTCRDQVARTKVSRNNVATTGWSKSLNARGTWALLGSLKTPNALHGAVNYMLWCPEPFCS